MAKKRVICDTDVMIDYFDIAKDRHKATKSILEDNIRLDNVWLSAITQMELLTGATNREALISINKKLKRFNIFSLNNEITVASLNLLQEYNLSHGLLIADSLIAATALEADLELFTYNVKDFKFISGLRLYSI